MIFKSNDSTKLRKPHHHTTYEQNHSASSVVESAKMRTENNRSWNTEQDAMHTVHRQSQYIVQERTFPEVKVNGKI